MNNRVWYYSTETRQLINDKEYHGENSVGMFSRSSCSCQLRTMHGMAAGTVSQVVLSADYAAVRVDGQVILHPYDPNFNVPAGRDDKRFPAQTSKGGDKNVTWVSMTNDFLVYGTSRGFVHYFYIKQVRLAPALSSRANVPSLLPCLPVAARWLCVLVPGLTRTVSAVG